MATLALGVAFAVVGGASMAIAADRAAGSTGGGSSSTPVDAQLLLDLDVLRDPELRSSLAAPAVRWLTISTVAVTARVTMIVVYFVTYLRTRGYSPSNAALGAGAFGQVGVGRKREVAVA